MTVLFFGPDFAPFMPSASNFSGHYGTAKAKRYYLQEILLGLLPLLISGQILIGVALTANALRGDADFRQLYAAGYMVRTGHAHELYDYRAQIRYQAESVSPDEPFLPFIRPAYQALIFVPFSVLGYRQAYLAFLALNLLLLFAIYRLLRPSLANFAARWRWFPLCFFLSFMPISIALIQGQDTIILLALLSFAFRSYDLGQDFLGGAVLALGLFKLQIVLPIALLFLVWRRWKFVSGFAGLGVLLACVSLLITGISQSHEFVRLMWGVGGSASLFDTHQALLRVDFMPNLRGLIYGVLGSILPDVYVRRLTISLSTVLFLYVVFRCRKAPSPSDAFKIAVLTSVVLSYYLLIHDLTIAVLPLALILNHSLQLPARPSLRDRCETWVALLAFLMPAYMLFGIEHLYLLSVPFIVLLLLVTGRPLRESQPVQWTAQSS